MTLRPFFYYYGGKYRAAPKYPQPIYDEIVEPFCGSAGYSLRFYDRKVSLYDADPIIFGIWDFLIRSSEEDIMKLPAKIKHVDEIKSCQESKWLVGFWLNKATEYPCLTPSKWMRDGWHPNTCWGEEIRERIVSQQKYIRHWKVSNRKYAYLENREATWFIDPPYHISGKRYRFNDIDYRHLSAWCQDRLGQVVVCEQEGADWLPFREFATIKATTGPKRTGISKEVIWTNA